MNDLVLITSVINTGTQPWSYTGKRSMYNPDQRFQQTLQTIDSIRVYLPSAKILLVECSEIPDDFTKTLLTKTDYFINLYEYEYVRNACLETNKKGYGEAVQTKFAVEFILQNKLVFSRMFKISGRYFFTEKFHQENYANDRFTFKRRADTHDGTISISTVVFSFPYSLLEHFYKSVCSVVHYYETQGPRGYEELLPILCEPRQEIEILGVSGYVAVPPVVFFSA